MGSKRFTYLFAACVLALAWAAPAHAGGQASPLDDDVVTTPAPVFTVELLPDDVNARIDVTTEAGEAVGSCTPAPTTCSLAAPLANGAYLWTLYFQNPFCDGYLGEICQLVDRSAGPRRLVVALPRVEPRTLVPGRAIGAARLGMTEDEALELYGEPLRTRGATSVFAVEGGVLEITFAAGRATALSTTSAYYRSAAGIAVGAKAPRGWKRVGAELVRGSTRLTVVRGRVVRVTVRIR